MKTLESSGSSSFSNCSKLKSLLTNVHLGVTSIFFDTTVLKEVSYSIDPNIKDSSFKLGHGLGFQHRRFGSWCCHGGFELDLLRIDRLVYAQNRRPLPSRH